MMFSCVAWLSALNRYLPVPDLTLYLDVRPEVAVNRVLARTKAPKWEETDLDRVSGARSAFLEQPWGRRDTYRVVDAERPAEEIAEQVREIVATTLGLTFGDPIAASSP